MKISEIIINNYRAFYNEKGQEKTKYRIDLGKGKSLLIYGENGSGKSSLYKGLKDFFRSSMDDCKVIENVFSRQLELDHQPFIEVVFAEKEDPTVYKFSADVGITNTNDDLLRSVVRSRSFMTYRDLMRVHFIDGSQVNLFDFLFGKNGLLAELPNPVFSQPETNLKLYDLWQVIINNPDDINVSDLCNGINQILTDLTDPLNSLLKYFDKSLSVTFSRLLEQDIRSGHPFINLNVKYFDVNLSEESEQYHHFLNEARLSALAICIFLAAHLSIPSAPYEILFLDDIFTGLDTSNRIPLLDIITADVIKGTVADTFTKHQIILTTYDRQWYELAKKHLGESEWSFKELYIDRHTNGFDHPALLPSESDFEKAEYYFKMKQYPACANYQRKICESLIKQFLPDYKKYDVLSNGSIQPIEKLDTLINNLRIYLLENGIDFTPFSKLKNCLRVVMNPMSHDDLESPIYRRELELVFEIIENLRKLKNTIILDSGKKIRMRKNHGITGLPREYILELESPFRKLMYGEEVYVSKFKVLPLTEEDEGSAKKRISFKGTLNEVYTKLCHSLQINAAANPLDDFEIQDGTSSLSQLL